MTLIPDCSASNQINLNDRLIIAKTLTSIEQALPHLMSKPLGKSREISVMLVLKLEQQKLLNSHMGIIVSLKWGLALSEFQSGIT